MRLFFVIRIETASQKHDIGVRSTMYAHLAGFLPCTKNTLIKRVKKLRLTAGDDKLKEPIARLSQGTKPKRFPVPETEQECYAIEDVRKCKYISRERFCMTFLPVADVIAAIDVALTIIMRVEFRMYIMW